MIFEQEEEQSKKKFIGFTLIELLIVIVIVAIVVLIVIVAINPRKMIVKSHDSKRVTQVTEISTAINLYLADNKKFTNLVGPYFSTSGSQTSRQKNDGTGWMPMKFNTISSGAPMSSLALDPVNNSIYHYTIGINAINNTYEIDCVFELPENIAKMSSDGGNNPSVYEVGTDLTILP